MNEADGKVKGGVKNDVFVLFHYWDTLDNEGHGVVGVYDCKDKAVREMQRQAKIIRGYFNKTYWDGDMTWEDTDEIHLGHDAKSYTEYYCWQIVSTTVK